MNPTPDEINRAIHEWLGGHWHEIPEEREWIPGKWPWSSGSWSPWTCINCGERVGAFSHYNAETDIEVRGVGENERSYTWDLNLIAKAEAKMIEAVGLVKYYAELMRLFMGEFDSTKNLTALHGTVATATALDRAKAIFFIH